MSLTLDLKIMLETVPILIFGEQVARRDMQLPARILSGMVQREIS
jgi:hypothetical protein